jgi:broad specificity phosphatase PhoE
MPPQTVMLIRHGEKPPDAGGPPYGIDETGTTDKHSLIVRGWTRAGALIGYFAEAAAGVVVPMHLFAAGNASSHGKRAGQTLAPLSGARGLPVDTTYTLGDEAGLAAAALALADPVLIAWEHRAIPSIVRALGLADFATEWPDRFDLVWILERGAGGYAFGSVPQRLLEGDRD